MFRFATCVLTIAGLSGVGPAHSEPDTIHARSIGQHGYIDSDWYICRSWDVYKKFNTLINDDTKAAFVLADRDCEKVRDQTEVVVEDTNWFFGDAICVRPVGLPDCGWVLPGAVTTARCTPTSISSDQTMTCVPRKNRDDPQRPWRFGFEGK